MPFFEFFNIGYGNCLKKFSDVNYLTPLLGMIKLIITASIQMVMITGHNIIKNIDSVPLMHRFYGCWWDITTLEKMIN